jgi:hypothetical protein
MKLHKPISSTTTCKAPFCRSFGPDTLKTQIISRKISRDGDG